MIYRIRTPSCGARDQWIGLTEGAVPFLELRILLFFSGYCYVVQRNFVGMNVALRAQCLLDSIVAHAHDMMIVCVYVCVWCVSKDSCVAVLLGLCSEIVKGSDCKIRKRIMRASTSVCGHMARSNNTGVPIGIMGSVIMVSRDFVSPCNK